MPPFLHLLCLCTFMSNFSPAYPAPDPRNPETGNFSIPVRGEGYQCRFYKEPSAAMSEKIKRNPNLYWYEYNHLKRKEQADAIVKQEAVKTLSSMFNEEQENKIEIIKAVGTQGDDTAAAFYRRLYQDPAMLDDFRKNIADTLRGKYAAFAKRLHEKLVKENVLGIGQPAEDTTGHADEQEAKYGGEFNV